MQLLSFVFLGLFTFVHYVDNTKFCDYYALKLKLTIKIVFRSAKDNASRQFKAGKSFLK